MEYTRLGSTGLEVSRLCLGCAGFGGDEDWQADDRDTAAAIIDGAIDAGINFLDTANVYSEGGSERVVGEAIAGRDREELVVASKVHGEMFDGPNGQGLSRKHVLDQAHASLDRLGLDYLDLYYLHRWDPDTPIAETLSALDHLVGEGLVRYVGASTMAGWQLMKALKTSDLEHHARFVAIQPEYSPVARHEERNMLPVAADQGLGVVTWSPLGAGFLAGGYRPDEPAALDSGETWRDLTVFDREDCWAVLEELRAVADRRGISTAQASVAWLLSKDVVDAPIIGPTSPSQLSEYLGALDVTLDAGEIEAVEAPIDPAWPLDAG